MNNYDYKTCNRYVSDGNYIKLFELKKQLDTKNIREVLCYAYLRILSNKTSNQSQLNFNEIIVKHGVNNTFISSKFKNVLPIYAIDLSDRIEVYTYSEIGWDSIEIQILHLEETEKTIIFNEFEPFKKELPNGSTIEIKNIYDETLSNDIKVKKGFSLTGVSSSNSTINLINVKDSIVLGDKTITTIDIHAKENIFAWGNLLPNHTLNNVSIGASWSKWYQGHFSNGVSSGSGTTRPSSPSKGMIWFDENLGKPIFYKGSSVWVDANGNTV